MYGLHRKNVIGACALTEQFARAQSIQMSPKWALNGVLRVAFSGVALFAVKH